MRLFSFARRPRALYEPVDQICNIGGYG